jgi:DNA-binding response OmpR family regulator
VNTCPYRIVIIEDDSDLRELERMSLELEGFEVHEADYGASGIRMVEVMQPDLVLMDVMMPGDLDGFQCCAQLRANPRTEHIKIVMVTARTQVADRTRATESGAHAFVTKPFSPAKLIEIVRTLLPAA